MFETTNLFLCTERERRPDVYYELYVDVFFLINFTMDTILLALLKKALACPVRYGRIIAGGVLGAV